MQNITITCAVLMLIALVSFYSQEMSHSHQKIMRDPVSKEVSPGLAETLKSGSLFEKRSKREVVRFSLYRSFEDPVWITLDLNEHKMVIETRGFEADPHANGEVDLVVKLDSRFVQAVKDEIMDSYLASPNKEGEIGLDGSTWIIEVTWDGKYYASDVWSPESGPEHQLGRLLFDRAQRYASLGALY